MICVICNDEINETSVTDGNIPGHDWCWRKYHYSIGTENNAIIYLENWHEHNEAWCRAIHKGDWSGKALDPDVQEIKEIYYEDWE